MKKNTLSIVLGLSLMGILFASCGSVKQTAFNERKYTNFRHHDPVVVFNTPEKKHLRETARPAQPAQVTVTPKATKATASVLHTTPKNVGKRESQHTVANTSSSNSDIKTVPSQSLESPAVYVPWPATEMASAATAEGGSGVSLVVLIILAIFIPPLAVYLYDNAATTRFWIVLALCVAAIILAWVLFIPFLGLLYLAGIIYAILIVTGHA